MSLELTEEHRGAWLVCSSLQLKTYLRSQLADALVIAVAGRRKAEFQMEHQLRFQGTCAGCKFLHDGTPDPRHNFTDDDWLREAREELGR